MTEQLPVAGWYTDTAGALRWWDGSAWTEHVRPWPDPVVAPSPVPSPPTPWPTGGTTFVEMPAAPRRAEPSVLPVAGESLWGGTGAVSSPGFPVTGLGTSVGMPTTAVRPVGTSRRGTSGGSGLTVVGGLLLIGICAASFLNAESHGGLIWIGAGISGTLMVARGVAGMVGSSAAPVRLDPAGAPPWTGSAPARPPRRGAGLLVVAALLAVLAVAGYLAWPSVTAMVSGSSPSTTTASVGRVAGSGASAAPATADTKPWVPDPYHAWKPVGTIAAYRVLTTNVVDCSAGVACSRILVASRHACAHLAVHVTFYATLQESSRDSATTYRTGAVRAGGTAELVVSTTHEGVPYWTLDSVRCA